MARERHYSTRVHTPVRLLTQHTTYVRVDCFRARLVAVVAAARERALTARRRFARFAVFHENVWSR
jgi:hypothetical protein